LAQTTSTEPTECTTSPPDDGSPGNRSTDGTPELIAWSLSLSPEERLAVLQDFVDSFWTEAHG
jgi:hypothetical protein